MRDGKQMVIGEASKAASAFQRDAAFAVTVDEVVVRLKNQIERAGLWVLQEIDPQAIVSRDGYRMNAARQLLFFHPKYMSQLLAADQAALLEAPLKFALLESDGKTLVRWLDPVGSFDRYDNQELSALGRELAEKCLHIIAGAA